MSPAIAGMPHGVHNAATNIPINPSLKFICTTIKYTLYTDNANATTDSIAPPTIVNSVSKNDTTSNIIINGNAIIFFMILIFMSSFV